MIVATPREALWAFINARLGIPWSSDFRALGLVKSDCLCAVVAYNGFTGRACFMHSAIDDSVAVDRTFVRAVFDYPFNECNVQTIIALVSSENTRALKLDKHVGFKEVSRLPGAGMDGHDLVILTMNRNECRWLKHGKEKYSPGA